MRHATIATFTVTYLLYMLLLHASSPVPILLAAYRPSFSDFWRCHSYILNILIMCLLYVYPVETRISSNGQKIQFQVNPRKVIPVL